MSSRIPASPGPPASKYPDKLEGEVAGCRVRLELDTRTVPWHEELTGTLLLEGDERTVTFSVHVGIELFPDQVPHGQELLPDRKWDALEVKPRERVRVRFALRMPGSVPIRRMRLRAAVHADWRHSATLTAEVHVAPPVPFQRMAGVLEELTGVAVRSWNTLELGDGLIAQFVPEKEGPRPFDALQLELFRNNGVIYGTLTLDPLNRTFADRLRSAAGVDRVSFPFRFPEADLSDVRPFYEQTLRPFTAERGDLPIPAPRPEPSAAELPLPSAADTT